MNTSLTACMSSGPTPSPGSMVTWNVLSDFAFSDCAESKEESDFLLHPRAQSKQDPQPASSEPEEGYLQREEYPHP